jgi:biopolymer transport protein ExbB/TolQ
MIEQLRSLLHLLGGALLWPVLVGLVVLLGWTCMVLGSVLREWMARRGSTSPSVEAFRASAQRIAREVGPHEREMELERTRQKADDTDFGRVASIRRAIRLGPALGLMGTLIPMADALDGLARGDLPTLAGNLVTAFSATVIGLAISVVAFMLGYAREQWAREDARERAVIADRVLASLPVSHRAPVDSANVASSGIAMVTG